MASALRSSATVSPGFFWIRRYWNPVPGNRPFLLLLLPSMRRRLPEMQWSKPWTKRRHPCYHSYPSCPPYRWATARRCHRSTKTILQFNFDSTIDGVPSPSKRHHRGRHRRSRCRTIGFRRSRRRCPCFFDAWPRETFSVVVVVVVVARSRRSQ